MLRAQRQFRRNLRDWGARVALGKVCAKALSPVCLRRVYRVYRIDLQTWPPREPLASGLQYRLVTREDAGLIEAIEDMEEWLEGALEQRLQNGSTCLVAIDGARLAGFNLTSFGQVHVPLLERTWTFRPDHAWSEQITVAHSHRRRGIACELRHRMFAELRARGIKRFYGGTLSANEGSLRLARKVGFSEILDVHYRKILGSRRYVCCRVLSIGRRLTQPLDPQSTSR